MPVNLREEMDDDQVTVTRVLVITGRRKWVNQTLKNSLVDVGKDFVMPHGFITEAHRTAIHPASIGVDDPVHGPYCQKFTVQSTQSMPEPHRIFCGLEADHGGLCKFSRCI